MLRVSLTIPNRKVIAVSGNRNLAIEIHPVAGCLGQADTCGGVYFECGCRTIQSTSDSTMIFAGGVVTAISLEHGVKPSLEGVLSEHIQGIDFLFRGGKHTHTLIELLTEGGRQRKAAFSIEITLVRTA